MNIKRRNVKFALKDTPDEQGVFEGYGSVFGNVDWYDEIVDQGAFVDSLAKRESEGAFPRMLWQHNYAEPIGTWLDMHEDEHGLYVKGQLALGSAVGGTDADDVRRAREAHTLLRMGGLDGLSIGYDLVGWEKDAEDAAIMHLTKLDLLEVSLVTFPANGRATVGAVKSVRDLESCLRDAGFSRRDAKAIASHGYDGLKHDARDAQDADALDAVSSRLDSLLAILKG